MRSSECRSSRNSGDVIVSHSFSFLALAAHILDKPPHIGLVHGFLLSGICNQFGVRIVTCGEETELGLRS